MSVKKFTYEEIMQLRASPYVLEASPNQVHFSAEFKEKFWAGIQEGKRPEEICADLGIDPEILGKNRLNGLRCIIRQEVKTGKGFRDLNTYRAYHEGCTNLETKIHYLEQQLAYKDQEIEFLKKIASLGKEGKQR